MGDLLKIGELRPGRAPGSRVPRAASRSAPVEPIPGLRTRSSRTESSWVARRPAEGAPAFFFSPGCPFSYLAAERVERLFANAHWIPVLPARAPDGQMALAEHRAAELGLPLVWPERYPQVSIALHRVAVYSAGVGAGVRFALAAGRLAFCGGFDLEDSGILAEAAASAGIDAEVCRVAAADPSHDEPLVRAARRLAAAPVTQLPTLRVGRRWFGGEASLGAAKASAAQ